jgi:ribosomal protein S6--L-glutamate ligase
LFAHQLLSRAGINMPVTTFAHYPGDTKNMIKMLGGAPLLIKLLDGPEGKGVVLAETNKAAEAVIQAFRGLKANFIAQEYLHDSKAKDLRCLVLGNKVLGAIEVATHLDDLSSISPAQFKTATLTLQERKLAIKATRVLGLKIAGVNLLRTKTGTRVVDVNSSPSFKNIETATGEDLALKVVEYIEHHARPRLPKRTIGFPV